MLTINATDLPRFMSCNGSRLMGGAMPPITNSNETRDEGIAAHYMAATVFRNEFALSELIDRKAPNGSFMTNEMAEYVEAYLNIRSQTRVGTSPFIELDADASHEFSPIWAVKGKLDYVEIDEHCDIHIIDFRYGWRIVEPERNWTLISHAISFVANYRVHPHTIIHLSIFQPRPYHPAGPFRTWKSYAWHRCSFCNRN